MNVVQRLTAGLGALIICLCLVAYFGISSINSINQQIHIITDRATPVSQHSSELSQKLSQINLIMLEHFNTRSIEKFERLAKEYQQAQEDLNVLIIELEKSLQQLPNNTEALDNLESIKNTAPDKLQVIARNMKIYEDSFLISTNLDAQRIKVAEVEEKMLSLYEKLLSFDYEDKDKNMLNNSYPSMVRGVGLLKQISLSSDMTQLTDSTEEFEKWMASYGGYGLKMLGMSRRTPEAKPTVKLHGEYLGEMTDLVTENDGIALNLIGWLTNRKTLISQLDKSQESLRLLSQRASNIQEFGVLFSSAITEDVQTQVDNRRWLIVVVSVVAAFVGVLVVSRVIKSVSKPLQAIVKLLHEMADGNLTHVFRKHRSDEIGLLFRSSESLNKSFVKLISSIKNQAALLNQSIEKNMDFSNATNKDLDRQKEQVDVVLGILQDMNETVELVNNNSKQAMDYMKEAEFVTERSQKSVDKNKTEIEMLSNQMERSVTIIKELDDDVKSIDEILQVISGIADQTNLLALNAAIEAARAGEQGRGFSVVADEVRNLAKRTQESTEQIRDKVTSMTGKSSTAVLSIEESQRGTLESVEKSEEVAQSMGEFVKVINNVKIISHEISDSSKAQQQSIDVVNENISVIANISAETKEGVQLTNEGNSNLKNSSNELSELIKEYKV